MNLLWFTPHLTVFFSFPLFSLQPEDPTFVPTSPGTKRDIDGWKPTTTLWNSSTVDITVLEWEMTEAVRVLQTAPVNTMVVATNLRNPVPAVKEAVNIGLIPWNPVPAITCSLRSTVGALTTISQDLRSTVAVVGPGLWSTVVTGGRSLRSTVKTVRQVPENTVGTAGMDHQSTVISIARDLWNAVVTAGMDHQSTVIAIARDLWNAVVTARTGLRSTVITVARSLWNVVVTDYQDLRNGTAAGITVVNQETIMTPTDLLDAGTGVDLQATRTEAAIDICQPHTATMKILQGVTPVTGATILRNVVTHLPDTVPGPGPP